MFSGLDCRVEDFGLGALGFSNVGLPFCARAV